MEPGLKELVGEAVLAKKALLFLRGERADSPIRRRDHRHRDLEPDQLDVNVMSAAKWLSLLTSDFSFLLLLFFMHFIFKDFQT